METLKSKLAYLKTMQIDCFALFIVKDNRIVSELRGKEIEKARDGQYICSTCKVIELKGFNSVYVAIVK